MKLQIKVLIIIISLATFCIINNSRTQDINGNGVFDSAELNKNTNNRNFGFLNSIQFNQYWESPSSMFSNVNDVAAGYFD